MAIATRVVSNRHSTPAVPLRRERMHAMDPSTRRAAAGPRPMVRATVGIVASPVRPSLTVVPRRRRAARLLAFLCVVIVASMLGAAAFQTLLAKRQLELDRLDQEIAAARENYDVLR